MPKTTRRAVRKRSKTRPLHGVTRSNSGAFCKSGPTPAQKRLDAFARKLLLSQTAGGANSWRVIGAWWNESKGHAHLMAHGKRPISPKVRARARGLYAPRKLRKFIQCVAVPFLARRWMD